MKNPMKRLLSLVLVFLLVAPVFFSETTLQSNAAQARYDNGEHMHQCEENVNCHSLSTEWFSDNEKVKSQNTKLELPVTEVLDAYFTEREQTFRTKQAVDASQSKAGLSSVVEAEAIQRVNGLIAFEERSQIRILDAETTVIYDQEHILRKDDESVTVFAYEWTFFDYDDLRDAASGTDVSGFGINHKIVIRPKGTGCEIVSDEYDATDIYGICTINETTKAELEELHWEPVDTDTEIMQKLAPYIRQSNSNDELNSTFYTSYSPDDCATYADQYVYHKAQGEGKVYESYYNSAYYNFNPDGGDCTNYTSQCIYAGGMPQVVGTAYGTDGWFYKTSTNRSATWTGAEFLRDWMADKRGTKVTASDSTILKGSPVFYGNSHATICVGTNAAGTPIINSHNSDYYHGVWTYYCNGSTTTTVQLTKDTTTTTTKPTISLNSIGTILYGQAHTITGKISSKSAITLVTGKIYSGTSVVMTATAKPNATSYNLAGSAIDNNLTFGTLATGTYKLEITAKNAAGTSKASVNFTIAKLPVLKQGGAQNTVRRVKTLQRMLIAKGYSCGSCGADGDFGSGTKSGVVKFQKAKGLSQTGAVNSATWTALLTACKIQTGSKGDLVKLAQQILISEGYSCGSCGADGDFGSGTRTAVIKFQKAKGLDQDGIIGKDTWTMLLLAYFY